MLLVISIIVLAVGSFVAVSFNIVPLKYSSLFYGLVFIIAGVAATTGISKVVYSKMAKSVGEHNATSLSFIVKIFGYTLTLLVLFSYFKISVTAALAAGGFSGLILGLASQNVMSNIFGGITILTTKPFKINDRITVSTWQYGLIAPAYPPKFWSNDFIIPGYTGIVKVVSLIYTQIITDDNVPLKIPNSVLIQAAIFVQSDSNSRMVKVKYEIPKIVDPELAISNIGRNLRSLKLIKNTPSIKVLESTLNTYIIVIDALCEGQYEELPKSEIIKITMRTVNRLVKRSR
ncbi:MAG: mechanosensitive ion channel family protein [Candidatus Marsarchaeota archaeon]|nr:mechanosensitive ion channel family protein [Candidatus Marsarchaeota archaeon]MCL5413462.1 mechanosensitive ion channel family protein [Candidatus Marsarchaeota archaeon]